MRENAAQSDHWNQINRLLVALSEIFRLSSTPVLTPSSGELGDFAWVSAAGWFERPSSPFCQDATSHALEVQAHSDIGASK